MSDSEPPETEPERLDSFIPWLRRDLIEMCIADGKLTSEQQQAFRKLADILCAWVHFQFLQTVGEIKKHLAPFDPDQEIAPRSVPEGGLEKSAAEVVRQFDSIAERANYFEITEEEIEKCFDAVTLIDLQTRVDLNDFKVVRCYARGDIHKTAQMKKFFRKKDVPVDILQRVLLLLHFQDEDHFNAKKKKDRPSGQSFQPGKIYTYLYKDVPKFDLELLFPNVRVGMTWKDKLMFGVPAIGGSVGVLIKAAPQILIIVGVVMFFTAGPDASARLGVTEESATSFMPVLTALMGVVIALGGLAFKQWSKYRKKRIEFLKDVSEQLFFRNLATNTSVFHRVIDSAEDEENKEMLLVLYHLITTRETPMTRAELDAHIETWMEEKFGTVIDFDIDGPLGNLMKMKGPGELGDETPVVREDEEGKLHTMKLIDARNLVDHLWDSAFPYS